MNEPTVDTLTQRLDWLEREVRVGRVVGGGTVAILGLILLLGATHTRVDDEIRAKRFVVVSDEGKKVAELSKHDPRFGPRSLASTLVLYDASQRPRVRFGESFGGQGLELLGRNGSSRARLLLAHASEDQPSLQFVDNSAAGWIRALLLLDEEGSPGLELLHPTTPDKALFEGGGPNVRRAQLTLNSDGSPVLYLRDQKEKIRVSLGRMDQLVVRVPEKPGEEIETVGTVQTPITSLVFFDEKGAINAGSLSLGLVEGHPSLSLRDETRRLRANLGYVKLRSTRTGETTETSVGSLVLFDKEGKVIWKAP